MDSREFSGTKAIKTWPLLALREESLRMSKTLVARVF
jgi:hypothetical protein